MKAGAPSVLSFAILLLFAAVTSAQPSPKQEPNVVIPYDGVEVFARLLDFAGLKPLERIEQVGAHVEIRKTVLVIMGGCDTLVQAEKHDPHFFQNFLAQGGSLLIASDRNFDFDVVSSLRWSRFHINGQRLVNEDPRMNFQGRSLCPVLSHDQFGDDSNHPIFAGVRTLATNCPGSLIQRQPNLPTLAVLPPGTHPDFDRWIAGVWPYIAGTRGNNDSRVLVVAGHGVFMNCMTVREDNDNRRFAFNVIRWLRGDGPAKRTHVLFVHEGKVQTNFNLPLVGPPHVPLPSIEAMNRIIDAVQKEGLLQRLIDNSVGPERILRGILILTTLAALAYGLKKLFQGRYVIDNTPLFVGIPDMKSTLLVRQRMRELSARGQFGEPARDLARDWFRTYAKINIPPHGPAPVLAFELHGGILNRRHVRRQVEALWSLAIHAPPADFDARKLLALEKTLEDLAYSLLQRELAFSPA